MSNNKNLMSENLKAEIAKELGVFDIVERDRWMAKRFR